MTRLPLIQGKHGCRHIAPGLLAFPPLGTPFKGMYLAEGFHQLLPAPSTSLSFLGLFLTAVTRIEHLSSSESAGCVQLCLDSASLPQPRSSNSWLQNLLPHLNSLPQILNLSGPTMGNTRSRLMFLILLLQQPSFKQRLRRPDRCQNTWPFKQE